MAGRNLESKEGGGEKELQIKNVSGSDSTEIQPNEENIMGRTVAKAELETYELSEAI